MGRVLDTPGSEEGMDEAAACDFPRLLTALKTDFADGGGSGSGGGGDLVAGVQRSIERGCFIANAATVTAAAAKAGTAGGDDGGIEGDSGSTGVPADDRSSIQFVLSSLYYINHALSALSMAGRILRAGPAAGADGVSDDDLASGIARFSAPDPEEANRLQQLLLYLLNAVQVRGYRRCHGELYRRIALPGALSTVDSHAWERVGDMRDFVYDVTRKEVNYDMWLNLTSMRTNMQAAVDHLMFCHDVQLPDLRKDRHVFSFSNGIYLAARDVFVPYADSAAMSTVATDVVAARFFDLPFPVGAAVGSGDWYTAIPTPHLQSIMDYQGMEEDVCRWLYVMIGRLIYEVNELDGWQVLPFLKGAASSGKSTILNRVCRGLYEPADVGTLSNNIERKFGLSALHDKLLFVGPEIKADIQLEQAEFQSIVSGESVQVAVKYRTAQSVEWRVPGALAGNEVPGWVDNSGSINRRIVIFEFPRRVHDGDMELGRKLDREMPAIILKVNRAYLQAVARHARDNIWKHLPAAFHAAKEEFTESVNSIVHFLRSGQLEFGAGLYMPFEHFSAAYEAYVSSMGLTRMKLTGDKIAHPLLEAHCKVVKNQTMKYPRGGSSVTTGRFIVGCDHADSGRVGGARPTDDLGDF